MPVVAIVTAAGKALLQLRKFLQDCQDGQDLEKTTKQNFLFYTSKVQEALRLYEAIEDNDEVAGDGFDQEVAKMQARLDDVLKEAEEKYNNWLKSKIVGVPLVFFKEHTEFFHAWLQDVQHLIAKYQEIRQKTLLAEKLAPDFKNVDMTAANNPRMKSILNELQDHEDDMEDLQILEELRKDPTSVFKYMGTPIVEAIWAASSNQCELFLVGSAVSVIERKGQIVRVCDKSDFPFHYAILFDDGVHPRYEWFHKSSIPPDNLERWGPDHVDIEEACKYQCEGSKQLQISTYDKRAFFEITANPRFFIKYYQHREGLVHVLEIHFEKKIVEIMRQEKYTTYLCLGNPGSGKSTILNGLVFHFTQTQTAVFESGFSAVEGATRYLQVKQFQTNRFADTPGLDDMRSKEDCAVEIERSLQEDGNYKVCFAVTLESGRVKPADFATMKLILQAAPSISEYGVIVNKITSKGVKALCETDEGAGKIRLMAEFNDLPRPPSKLEFMTRDEELEDEKNIVKALPAKILAMINGLTAIHVEKQDVKPLDVKDWEDKLEKIKQELNATHNKEISQLQKEHENIRRKAEESLAQQLEERDKKAKADMERLRQEAIAKDAKDAETRRRQEREIENLKAESARQKMALEDQLKQVKREMADEKVEAESKAKGLAEQRRQLEKKLKNKTNDIDRLELRPLVFHQDNQLVFFDLRVGGEYRGRVVIEVYVHPGEIGTNCSVGTFLALCTGEKGLHYKGTSIFHCRQYFSGYCGRSLNLFVGIFPPGKDIPHVFDTVNEFGDHLCISDQLIDPPSLPTVKTTVLNEGARLLDRLGGLKIEKPGRVFYYSSKKAGSCFRIVVDDFGDIKAGYPCIGCVKKGMEILEVLKSPYDVREGRKIVIEDCGKL